MPNPLDSAIEGLAQDPGVPSELEQVPTIDPASISSLTLRARIKRSAQVPETICATCPLSVWMETESDVTSYCRLMHRDTYTGRPATRLVRCDGPSMAKNIG